MALFVHRCYIFDFSWDDHSQHLVRFVEEFLHHDSLSLAENILLLGHCFLEILLDKHCYFTNGDEGIRECALRRHAYKALSLIK